MKLQRIDFANTRPMTWAGGWRGARDLWSALPAVAIFGVGFGAAAIGQGISPDLAIVMSAFVFAGSAQYSALELWTQPLPLLSIIIVTATVNARHLILSATLYPFVSGTGHLRTFTVLALLSDANWASTQKAAAEGEADLAHLVGGGLILWLCWLAGTAIGAFIGAAMGDLERWGVDILMPAFFICSLIALYRSHTDLPPWLSAAATAAMIMTIAAPHWAVLGGAAAGTMIEVMRREK